MKVTGEQEHWTLEQAREFFASSRRNKFSARRTTINGLHFDSQKEAHRYLILKDEERCGLVTHLERQVKFPIEVNRVFICNYIADFVYNRRTVENGRQIITRVIEDTKGFRTPLYKLKRQLMKAVYKVTIYET